MKNSHFCAICQRTFGSPSAFIKDRQEHISKGETKKQNGKSKTTTN
jgi:hypothetical protein